MAAGRKTTLFRFAIWRTDAPIKATPHFESTGQRLVLEVAPINTRPQATTIDWGQALTTVG
jgi:hypothetical protein